MKSSTPSRLLSALSACLLAGAAFQADAGEIARFDPNECGAPAYRRDW